MAGKKYRGSTNIARLITEYMELRKTNQTQVAKRIGRSQPSISHLMRGSESAEKERPYFGVKGPTSDADPLLLLVARDLRIPWAKVDEALNADQDEFMQYRMNLGRQRLAARYKTGSRKQSEWFVHSRRDQEVRFRKTSPKDTDQDKRAFLVSR